MSGTSLGYAERLSWRDDVGGTLGDPELSEPDANDLEGKIDRLAELFRDAKDGVTVHTGAGISTSAGIPDFRGPKGVWTLQKRGEPIPPAKCRFDRARPTPTHMALVELQRAGFVRYLVSCNVDCLHIRSGFPRDHLAELHGNCFAERCEKCGAEYIRDFEMPSVGFKPTGRRCVAKKGKGRCPGELMDQVLDWDDALPPKELRAAERHSREASLSLVLGSSLQIIPSCNLPLKTVRGGKGKLAIVNLQATGKDKKADVVIHEKTDVVMAGLMRRLGLTIPEYVHVDTARQWDKTFRPLKVDDEGGSAKRARVK
jgi:mono-ADP-ribosyltransferase sirtuin 6